MVLKPWITSRAISKGMPKRDSSIATRCKALPRTGSTSFRIDPVSYTQLCPLGEVILSAIATPLTNKTSRKQANFVQIAVMFLMLYL